MDKVFYLCCRAVMRKVFVACALGCLFGCGSKNQAADDTTSADAIKTPATVEQAAKVLDLSTFPLVDGAKTLEVPQVANLFYLAPGDVKPAFEFNRKALIAQGWKELPNSSVTDQSASAMFSRSGFVVFVTVTPHGEPGSVQVRLLNQGNVKPGKLPVPPNAKAVYVGDSTAMYETAAAVPATADAVRNSFIAQGWISYGDAPDTAVFKKNAILATAYISSAAAQGGKTSIQYSNQLISSDIPAPPNVDDLRYVDEPPELTFATANQDAIVEFYRKALAAAGWKSTMEKMVDVDGKPTMIFRNPAKEMITLAVPYDYGSGKLGVSVRFQSATELAERDRKMKEMAPRLRAEAEAKAAKEAKEAAELAEKNKPPKVAVTLPAGAKDVKQTNDSIKFTLGKGKAKAAIESFRTQFRDAGWKEEHASMEKMAGTLSFSKEGGGSVTVTYSDTGFMPTEVSLSAFRAELEAAK
jgi:hypothetical protein